MKEIFDKLKYQPKDGPERLSVAQVQISGIIGSVL